MQKNIEQWCIKNKTTVATQTTVVLKTTVWILRRVSPAGTSNIYAAAEDSAAFKTQSPFFKMIYEYGGVK